MLGALTALFELTARRAVAMLAIVAALTLAALAQIVDPTTGRLLLGLDASLDSMLPEDDEGRRYYEHARKLFGSDETILVALADDDIFTADNLARVVRMTERIDALEGVHHTVSLNTAVDVRSVDGVLEIVPFLEKFPETPAERAALRDRVLANPVYAGNLVSRDGRATVLAVHLRDRPEQELVDGGLIDGIEAIVAEEAGGLETWITGGLYAKGETSRLMLRDIERTLPLAIVVAMAIAGLCFRSLRGVLIPITTTAIAVIWTLGFVAATGTALNLLTVIIPTLLLVVGFAYAIHVVSEYYDVAAEEPGLAGVAVVREALARVALPVVLTGITTAAGFLSLTTSPIVSIREFGLYSTLGIAFTGIASLTFAPAMLALLPVPRKRRERSSDGRFDRAMERLAVFDVRHRTALLLAGGLVAAIAVAGMFRIDVSTAFVEAGSSLARSAAALDEHLGGANAFSVVIAAENDGAFKEPDVLTATREFQHWIDSQPEVGGTTSLVDFLLLIQRGFEDGPGDGAIPESRTFISQLFFFGASDDLDQFVDSKFRTTSITVRCRVNDSAAMEALLARIEARGAQLQGGLSATVTGNTVLLTRTIDDITRGQATSLAFAFAMIFAVLSLLFMSPRIGFLALIPNTLPVLFYFGFLGLSGITLNSTTGLVACLVLGIAVDDTIHLLARFNEAAKRHASVERGISEAMRSVGRPVTYTTLAMCAGFLALTRSDFQNQVQFGALASLTLAFAWLVDVTFTPALASRMRIVNLWDALTLDLGEDPQLSIPLFRGLRKTQARIAALMTTIVEYPRGHRLFSAGEEGRHMYVIIDGELKASVRGDDGAAVTFGVLGRGDSVGEVGLFHGVRTADVDVESDVRMLRLTRETLERIQRRYPRTAARLYANLSDILADRVASTTARVH